MTLVIIMKFKIAEGREKEFEALIEERSKIVKKQPGFKQVYLLVPLGSKEYRLVSWWDKLDQHEAWIRQESYALGHDEKHAGLVVGTVPFEVAMVARQW